MSSSSSSGLALSNNATSRLASNISATSTTIQLMAGSGALFPAISVSQWFPVTVLSRDGDVEIMKCTARSGDILTVARGIEGTAASAFQQGALVELRMTAGTFIDEVTRTATNEVYGITRIAKDSELTMESTELVPNAAQLTSLYTRMSVTEGRVSALGAAVEEVLPDGTEDGQTLLWDADAQEWKLGFVSEIPVGTFSHVPKNSTGWIDIAYDSNTSVPAATYPKLVEARYCGDANNATAGWFYRADDMAGTQRNVNGAYFILPGLKEYFLRPGDEGWTKHEDQMQGHWHRIRGRYAGGATGDVVNMRDRTSTGFVASGIDTVVDPVSDGINGEPRTGSETYPKHIYTNIAIKAYDTATNQEQVDIAYLINKVQALEAEKLSVADDDARSTILYPNGGTAEIPANVTVNQRIVMDNPYPGYYVVCEAQAKFNGIWGTTGFIYSASAGGYGIEAYQFGESNQLVVVQTGSYSLSTAGTYTGGPHGQFGNYSTLPCRVIVTRLGKIQ